MANATPQIDPSNGFYRTLRRTRTGWAARQTYLIDHPSDDPVACFLATGLPVVGDVFDARIPTLVLKEYGELERWGGKQDLATTSKVWSKLDALYATPEPGVFSHLPRDVNDKWTQWSCGLAQVNVTFPLERFNDPSPLMPIRNGDGTNINVGTFELSVYTFKLLTATLDRGRWVSLSRPACKTNADSLDLPGEYTGGVGGGGGQIHFDKGQLLFVGVETDIVDQYRQVVFKFQASSDFYDRWAAQDKKGNPDLTSFGGEIVDRVYEKADFSGLW